MDKTGLTLRPARYAGPASVTLDMKMPSSSPLYGVEPRPPAMDSPKPPVVRSTTTSICFTSTTTDGPDSDKVMWISYNYDLKEHKRMKETLQKRKNSR